MWKRVAIIAVVACIFASDLKIGMHLGLVDFAVECAHSSNSCKKIHYALTLFLEKSLL